MKLVGVDEAAAALGVGRARVYDLARADALPHVRLGRRQLRFDMEQLRAWIASGGRSRGDRDQAGCDEAPRQ